jgi:hypothetical protein
MAFVASETEQLSLSQAGPAAAERALMRAVLEDAVRCLAGEIGPRQERPVLAAEARAWIETADDRWPFSFENICDGLGFDVELMRARLLQSAPTLPIPEKTPTRMPVARERRTAPEERDIVRMIREGQPLRVVADTFGISVSKASILSCGLASRIKAERDEEIGRLRRAGWTHRALAARFRLSRIRIMRICARHDRGTDRRSAAA